MCAREHSQLVVVVIVLFLGTPLGLVTVSSPAEAAPVDSNPGVIGPDAANAVAEGTPHAPIAIHGNDGFSADAGVVRGDGTQENPFVIEGWEISVGCDVRAIGVTD